MPTAPSTNARPAPPLAPPGAVGGIGGLAFVASVIAQNALRAGFPPNDASAVRVAAYYADHRGVTIALAVLFPIGALGLAAFLGALLSRIGDGDHRAAAYAGAFGAAGIVGTYTMLIASDLGLAGAVHRGDPAADIVSGLWVFHNAVFGVLLTSIGIALAGLSAASAASGLLGEWWKRAGLLGAVLLLVASATTPLIIDASPTMAIGLVGFLVWIGFVTVAAIKLLRTTSAGTAHPDPSRTALGT